MWDLPSLYSVVTSEAVRNDEFSVIADTATCTIKKISILIHQYCISNKLPCCWLSTSIVDDLFFQWPIYIWIIISCGITSITYFFPIKNKTQILYLPSLKLIGRSVTSISFSYSSISALIPCGVTTPAFNSVKRWYLVVIFRAILCWLGSDSLFLTKYASYPSTLRSV